MIARTCVLIASVLVAAATPLQLTDGMILGSIGTADANELEAAKLASKKAGSQAVKDYANMLVRDHTNSQAAGLALAKRLGLRILLPTDTTIEAGHKQEMDQLNLLTPSAFDKAFVQYMVADHLLIITKVDSTLVPGAKNLQVKSYLRRLRPTLEMHRLAGQQWLDKNP